MLRGMPRSRIPVFAAFLALAACASQAITLPEYGAAAPADTDLSGSWRLKDAGSSAETPPDALVQVFLEYGKVLKITQTDFGLFISFDRAIVEEYRFGEQREVDVGPIKAQRSSGWEGRSYVTETLDRERVKLVERYRLDPRSEALLRVLEIWRGDTRLFQQQQVFEKD